MTKTPDWIAARREELILQHRGALPAIEALIAKHETPPPDPVEQLARKVMAAYDDTTDETPHYRVWPS